MTSAKGIFHGPYFSMRTAEDFVVSFTQDHPVLHQDGANQGIRRDPSEPQSGKFERTLHEPDIQHVAKLGRKRWFRSSPYFRRMNWGEFVRLSRERLPSEYEEEERIAVIERLIEGRCSMRRIDLVIRRADVIEAEAETRLMDDLARLERGEPVQYVLGRAPFMGMNLQVSPAVLIPRQETEEVVRQAMDKARSWMARYPGTRLRILDVGTGSGCIAISLAKAFPMVR